MPTSTRIIGLTMDDNDRLFVPIPDCATYWSSTPSTKPKTLSATAWLSPAMLAIDTQNRLLYVSDITLDQILVYDADSLKLKRKMGTTGKNHELTTPGDFAKPTGVAVDKEGNLYVADTLNDRIEVFDADGGFIRAWGKNGDGPGYFARPKGVAIDTDGHIWVADGMQDRVQVFTPEGQLLITMGGHGLLPGQYQGLVNIASDNRRNRIYTSEIYPWAGAGIPLCQRRRVRPVAQGAGSAARRHCSEESGRGAQRSSAKASRAEQRSATKVSEDRAVGCDCRKCGQLQQSCDHVAKCNTSSELTASAHNV